MKILKGFVYAAALFVLFGCVEKNNPVIPDPGPIDYDEMVFVEGGMFTMGCTPEQAGDCLYSEEPAHSVTLNGYYIGKYLVTQKRWRDIMGGSTLTRACDNCPVELVSWNDVVNEFLPRLNEITGNDYRLPTEEEWEFAARGGVFGGGYKYSGSDKIDEVAWYADNSGSQTHPVGEKNANELGIYDMNGNVSEWVDDMWFGSYDADPPGPFRGFVYRGGDYGSTALYCRVSSRNGGYPDVKIRGTGFRLAMSHTKR
jgi:formylglycine-generating enzyme required for sulfatase activity